jgi:SAM-dependent methyltransferase
MEPRKLQERAFHNALVQDGTRERVEKFYTVARASARFYEDYLRRHCTDQDVLEYGCGPGSYAFFLAEHGARVTAIDISDLSIEHAAAQARKKVHKGIAFRVMDAEALDFEDASWDLICGTGVLHHLDRDRAFSELARTLKPDGSAIFREPLGHNPLINLYRRATPQLRSPSCVPLRLREIALARRYFGRVETQFFHLQSLAAVPARKLPGFGRLLDGLEAADRVLFRLVPATRRYAWMVIMVLSKPQKVPYAS